MKLQRLVVFLVARVAAGGGGRNSKIAPRFEFGVEELAHPFTAMAQWLCAADAEMARCGPPAVRRALLAVSVSSKGMKAVDGTVHKVTAVGSSAASGTSIAEKLSVARDIRGVKPKSLRRRAAAVFRAQVVEEAFEACELVERAAVDDEVLTGVDESCVVSACVDARNRLVVVVRWVSGFAEVLKCVETPPMDIALRGNNAPPVAVNPVFWKIATQVCAALQELLAEKGLERVHCVGHGAGGSIAALVAAQLGGVLWRPSNTTAPLMSSLPCTALALGPAPCVSRTAQLTSNAAPSRVRVTSIALGDDIMCRLSRASVVRLRTRLRRFLPSSKQQGRQRLGGIGAMMDGTLRIGAALAGGTLEQSMAAATRAAKSVPSDRLALPGDVVFLKPRSDASVGLYDLKPTNRAREEILWQLNDVLLSKSMLAHHALDSYISSLERL